MDGFQSLFDVDTDALKVADFDSVFGNSAESSEQFDNIFGAEEDDRLMEAVIGFTEDGTELPDEDELHNNEEGDLGEDGVTPKNFGDGIFDDETDNTPKHDTSDNADVIDRRGGAEGAQNVLDLGCPKTGVQDNGCAKAMSDDDVNHLNNAAGAETDKAGKDMQNEIDDTVNEAADFYDSLFEEGPVEGTQPVLDLDCPKSGIQDNGNTAEVDDDDDVEHLMDAGEDEADKAGEEGAKEIEDTTVDEAADFYDSLLEEDIPDVGAKPDKDDLGLPAKDGNEGEVKDANTEYQDDLDESFLAEADEDDEDEEDSSDTDDSVDESALFGEDANSLDQEDDADIGLPMNNGTEGKIGTDKDYQDDLDESCLFESDDTDDDDFDGGDDDEDDDEGDSGDEDLDFGGDDSDVPAKGKHKEDIDFGDDEDDDDLEDDEDDLAESYLFESDDDSKDDSSDAAADAANAQNDDPEDPGNKSTNEAAALYDSLFEDTDVQDELNDVVDDEERRDGAEPAVDTKEGEEAPADNLDECGDASCDDEDEEELKEFAEFITEEDDPTKDDSPVDEAIDDDAIETVDDNDASGEGPLDLDYDASDDELFDDSVEED